MRSGWILLPALLLVMPGRAQALETYCDGQGGRVHDGGEYHRTWTVVHPSARRVQLPGQTKPTTWCTSSWASVGGMYRPIEIIKPPKHGKGQISSTYRVSYLASKLGPDEMSIRIHWVGMTGQLQSAVVHYRINVIDRPL
jgi:hypothetical protein